MGARCLGRSGASAACASKCARGSHARSHAKGASASGRVRQTSWRLATTPQLDIHTSLMVQVERPHRYCILGGGSGGGWADIDSGAPVVLLHCFTADARTFPAKATRARSFSRLQHRSRHARIVSHHRHHRQHEMITQRSVPYKCCASARLAATSSSLPRLLLPAPVGSPFFCPVSHSHSSFTLRDTSPDPLS